MLDQDTRSALIVEALTQINARLRVLDETIARLEADVERQLEMLESFVIRFEQQLVSPERKAPLVASGNSSQQDRCSETEDASGGWFIDGDKEYSRDTHPTLFKVIDLLEQDEHLRALSVRRLAQQTGVSKSWCAVAKRYVSKEKSVH